MGRYSKFTCDTEWGDVSSPFAGTLTIRILPIGTGKLCAPTTIGEEGVPVAVPYTPPARTRIRPEWSCPK
jgi:hypothetical protein